MRGYAASLFFLVLFLFLAQTKRNAEKDCVGTKNVIFGINGTKKYSPCEKKFAV